MESGSSAGGNVIALPTGRASAAGVDLASEAHHRISRNLFFLSGLARARIADIRHRRDALGPGEVAHLLEEISTRLRAAGQLHRMLASGPDVPAIDLGNYLQLLVRSLVKALAEDGIRLSFASELPCRIGSHRALPVAMIVCELVANAIRYAHPAGTAGSISVVCHGGDRSGVTIEVADDGVGLPEGFDPATGGGHGFRSMRLLAQRVGGTLGFDSGPMGLRATLRLAAG